MERINGITLCRNCRTVFNGIAPWDYNVGQPICPGCESKSIVLASADFVFDLLDAAERLEAAKRTSAWDDKGDHEQ